MEEIVKVSMEDEVEELKVDWVEDVSKASIGLS